jgi:hypothetical protein
MPKLCYSVGTVKVGVLSHESFDDKKKSEADRPDVIY